MLICWHCYLMWTTHHSRIILVFVFYFYPALNTWYDMFLLFCIFSFYTTQLMHSYFLCIIIFLKNSPWHVLPMTRTSKNYGKCEHALLKGKHFSHAIICPTCKPSHKWAWQTICSIFKITEHSQLTLHPRARTYPGLVRQ
jgi:hypothetical protein